MELINRMKEDLILLKQTADFITTPFVHKWEDGKIEYTNNIAINGGTRLAQTISDYLNDHKAEVLAQCIKDQEADILAAEESRLAEARAVIEQLEPELAAAKMAGEVIPMQDMTTDK